MYDVLREKLDHIKKERFINEFISDIANSNRPTSKYFIKRFTQHRNKYGKTLVEKIYEYIIALLQSVFQSLEEERIKFSKTFESISNEDLNKYISLIKKLCNSWNEYETYNES